MHLRSRYFNATYCMKGQKKAFKKLDLFNGYLTMDNQYKLCKVAASHGFQGHC